MNPRICMVAAASLGLAACSTTASYSSDFDEQQDFSGYKTFAWAGESPMTVFGDIRIPPTVEPRITRAIKAELEAKGYTYVEEPTKADFAVAFSVGTRTEQQVTQTPTYFYGNRTNWRWGRVYYPGYYPEMTTTEVRTYNEGTLAIDIYDVERKSPVWHGAGVKTLSRAEARGEAALADQAKLQAGVANILEGFPPQ